MPFSVCFRGELDQHLGDANESGKLMSDDGKTLYRRITLRKVQK